MDAQVRNLSTASSDQASVRAASNDETTQLAKMRAHRRTSFQFTRVARLSLLLLLL